VRSRRAGAFALALAASGCFGGASRPYPADWPPRVSAQGGACPLLTGTWRNVAEEDPFVFGERTLVAALRGPPPAGRPAAVPAYAVETVRLDGPEGDELRVTTAPGDEAPVVLRRGKDFDCEAGTLEVLLPSGGGNANVCYATEWRSTVLARDASGHLVASLRSRALCFGLFALIYEWQTEWARFHAVETTPAGGPAAPPDAWPTDPPTGRPLARSHRPRSQERGRDEEVGALRRRGRSPASDLLGRVRPRSTRRLRRPSRWRRANGAAPRASAAPARGSTNVRPPVARGAAAIASARGPHLVARGRMACRRACAHARSPEEDGRAGC
jgi:hypothetical protein